jgi:hypothetical protein
VTAAWLYLRCPMWLVRLLPDSVNHAESGPFSEAVERACNRPANRLNWGANDRLRRESGAAISEEEL